MRKTQKQKFAIIHTLKFFNIISFKQNAFFPWMCERFNTVVEEIFVLLFKPAIYRTDNFLITVKCLSMK